MPTDNRTLIMTRADLDDLSDAALPTGVSLRPYCAGDKAVWTQIWRDAEPFDAIKDSTFHESLGADEGVLSERVWFAVDDATGEAIGTVTAWSEPKSSESHPAQRGFGRVHWVAVVPTWQGRGIGQAMLRHCLTELRRFGHNETFLVTSAGRTGAVALYQKHGFVVAEMDASGE
ncbi:MAG: GNAT family N-acetyltransferase [Armatimonadetes bacterium]|nr:GNAT family N-acetyltransferase [Armatimonadota bacterium]